jgi:hypothetical protein
MTLLRAGLLTVLFAITPLSEAASWGASGHAIIAEIAQRRLHPQAVRKIRELLGGDVSLASVASWADELALLRPNTANWHFVNIPYDAVSYDPARDCKDTPRGDCVINAIARARSLLSDRMVSRRQRAEALMFLIHFVGDVHQPLHAADRHDAGGSQVSSTGENTSGIWTSAGYAAKILTPCSAGARSTGPWRRIGPRLTSPMSCRKT